jgi:GDP-D-mannose 3',5'-epimerase
MKKIDAVVLGGGGFIGGYLVKSLLSQGKSVRSIDIKDIQRWNQIHKLAENLQLDLSTLDSCKRAVNGARYVYNLAADMGGMGFIEKHKAECMLSVLINANALLASKNEQVERYFYSSSACVYRQDRQNSDNQTALREEDAYPAFPEDGYGWEKLFGEIMCRNFYEDFGLETRVARFHNVYGPNGTWSGDREKAPAAICRKVAEAVLLKDHQIDIWGDGQQVRSFMYIDDCIKGIHLIMDGEYHEPVNLGRSERVTINQLVGIVEEIAHIKLTRSYRLDEPKGVRSRNSDNTMIVSRYGWEPSIPLEYGMEKTYQWIYDQVKESITDEE